MKVREMMLLPKQYQADKFHRQPYLRIHHRYQKLPFLLSSLGDCTEYSQIGASPPPCQTAIRFHLIMLLFFNIPNDYTTFKSKILLFSVFLAINVSIAILIFSPLEQNLFLTKCCVETAFSFLFIPDNDRDLASLYCSRIFEISFYHFHDF